MRPPRPAIRSLAPQLPAAVWTLQAGGLANALGTGLAIPFLPIYLHSVRGMSLGLVGAVLATQGLMQLVGCWLAGTIVDRLGGRLTLSVALLLQAAAWGLFPLVHHPWQAVALMALDGLGASAYWPAQSVLLTRLTPAPRVHSAFALQRVTMNLGIGIGGLSGGLIARASDPGSFTMLFLLDMATFVVFAAVVRLVRDPGRPDRDAGVRRPGYREVAADRVFARVFLLNAFLVAGGYALLSLVTPFGTDQAGVSERSIGLIWLVNTLAVVAFQMPISRLIEGRRRMLCMVAMGGVWAMAWLLVAAGGAWFDAAAATVVLALALGIFGVGECLHGAVYGPLVADLAPPQLQGRYFAVSSMSWGLGMAIGPAIGGLVLQANPFALWPLAAGCSLLVGVVALRVERSLPARVRRTAG